MGQVTGLALYQDNDTRRSITVMYQMLLVGTCCQTCSFARMSSQKKKLSELVKRLGELGDGQDRVSIHDIREVLGARSFGPIIAVPALIEITPIGASRACRP